MSLYHQVRLNMTKTHIYSQTKAPKVFVLPLMVSDGAPLQDKRCHRLPGPGPAPGATHGRSQPNGAAAAVPAQLTSP